MNSGINSKTVFHKISGYGNVNSKCKHTRSSAVAVIGDSRSYCLQHMVQLQTIVCSSCGQQSAPVFGTCLRFQTEVCFWSLSAFYHLSVFFSISFCAECWHSLYFLARQHILQQKCLKKWIGSALLETQMVQLSPPPPRSKPNHKRWFYLLF